MPENRFPPTSGLKTVSNLVPPRCFHQMRTAIIALAAKASRYKHSLTNHLHDTLEYIHRSQTPIMAILLLLLTLLAIGAISGGATLQNGTNHALKPPLSGNYSTDMVLSIISRQQGFMNDTKQPSLALQAGIVQKALAAWSAQYGENAMIRQYIGSVTASAARYMTNTIDDLKHWPLDRLSAGTSMFGSQDPAYGLALDALRDSVRLNQRNKEGGLWYWEGYPQWSYLDGMYSLGPFAATDARQTSSPMDRGSAALQDMRLQFRLLWEHCHNGTTGLLTHGYDESRTASWASGRTGASGVVWGRSLGWFLMALVDTLELLWGHALPAETPDAAASTAEPLLAMYQDLAAAVVASADPATGGWYQVVDQQRREGNYLESSATAMFSYALLKGARLGYLHVGRATAATKAGRAAHDFLAREFVIRQANGTLGWNGTVAVCSLNSSATYDYYIEQPIAYNSVLGAAAFIMSSLEVERLGMEQITPQGGDTPQGGATTQGDETDEGDY
ncbi:hypothetical protein diail_3334 [Diaporthe ilicicola]|nr:hypothetical protein diail_3334 [Diaporthe ilicicola]